MYKFQAQIVKGLTMAIDRSYIPAFSLEAVFRDKDTGEPLANGTIDFFQDNDRVQRKAVYQITGTSPNYTFTPLPNPMTLSIAGTLVDGSNNPVVPYFLPFDAQGNAEYYYVVVKNSGGVEQFTRESVPYIPNLSGDDEGTTNYSNQISNPQFVEVLFNETDPSFTYTFSGAANTAVPLAPDWDLVVSGTGSVIVSRQKPAGTQNLATKPPYLLQIQSTGSITLLQLRQRLHGSPNLWAENNISSRIFGRTNGADAQITMSYVNTAGTSQQLLQGTFTLADGYTILPGNVLLNASADSATAPSAYIDIVIDLPTSIEVQISSIQVVFTGETVVSVPYVQTTQNRQLDQLFNYYKPLLEYKPIQSLLTAWDFPLNPAQDGVIGTINTTAKYIWDQTIARAHTHNVSYARSSRTSGLQCTTTNTNDAFYILQYLSGAQAKKILGTKLSVNVNAYKTAAGDDVTCRVYLYRGSSAANIPSLSTTIGTIAADGTFTLTAANWTEIPRAGLKTPSATLNVVSNDNDINNDNDYGFNNWEITDNTEISDTDKFAIVVTFAYVDTSTVITVDSISLVPGNIPTRPAPQTADQVLKECEYYFEKSYNQGSTIPSAATAGSILKQMLINPTGSISVTIKGKSFSFDYLNAKRAEPNITFYPVQGTLTANNLTVFVYRDGSALAASAGSNPQNIALSGNFTKTNFGNGRKRAEYRTLKTSAVNNIASFTASSATRADDEAFIMFHYVANARLGVV